MTAEEVKEAYHIHGDGSNVESITTETDDYGRTFTNVVVRVPGFSRYSLGGGSSYAPEAW